MPVLSTNRYLFIGTYIGQYISPKNVQLSGEARLPTAIGRGSRLAQVYDAEIVKGFVYREQLTFSPTAPFRANLDYISNGSQESPIKLSKANGEVVRPDQYHFIADCDGNYSIVEIRAEVFDQTATYYIDYQSLDRSVTDSLPVDNLREIRAIGDQVSQEKYIEYSDYYIPMLFSEIVGDAGNALHDSSLQTPLNLVHNGTGVITKASSASYNHKYNRYYTVVCTNVTGTVGAGNRTATFSWVSTPASGGNFAFPPNPLHSLAPANLFTIDETVPTSIEQTL
jgi:hypothetical protein